jgi:hypothetical protein
MISQGDSFWLDLDIRNTGLTPYALLARVLKSAKASGLTIIIESDIEQQSSDKYRVRLWNKGAPFEETTLESIMATAGEVKLESKLDTALNALAATPAKLTATLNQITEDAFIPPSLTLAADKGSKRLLIGLALALALVIAYKLL